MVSKLAAFLQLFLLLFLKHRGFSSGEAGLALGVWGAGVVAGSATGGWLCDRINARTTIMISMFGAAGLMISLVYIRVYLLLLLAVLLVSAVGQLYRPAAQTLMTELTPPGQQVMVTAMYLQCFNMGIVVAPLVGTALASVSYYLLFWTEGLALLAVGMIAVLALPRRAMTGAKPVQPESAQPPSATPKQARGGYMAVLTDWRYVTFLVAFLLMATVYCQYTVALPLAIKQSGLSTWWYGMILSLNGAMCGICQIPATKLVRKWSLLLIQLLGFGLLAVGYGIYAIAMVPLVLIIGTVTWTVSDLIGVPTMFAYPGMVAPDQLRGRYFAALLSVHGAALSFGPLLGVALYEHFGQRAWLCLAGIALLATIIGQVGLRRPKAGPGTEPEPELAQAELVS
jgi:MFS family permease